MEMQELKGNKKRFAKTKKSELRNLAFEGRLKELENILAKGTSLTIKKEIREVNQDGRTAIHNAVIGVGPDQENILRILLDFYYKKGSEVVEGKVDLVNQGDRKGRTPLGLAALYRRPELIKFLLKECKADPRKKDNFGMGLIQLCAMGQANRENVEECISILTEEKELKVNEQVKGSGRTALHFAASRKGDSTIVALLNAGANPDISDFRGMSPLHCAVISGDTLESVNCVEILLEKMDSEKINDGTVLPRDEDFVVEVDELGEGSSSGGVSSSDESEKPKRIPTFGKTALHLAAWKSHGNVIKALLEDDRVDFAAKDSDGRNALHYAIESCCIRGRTLECVKLLVDASSKLESSEQLSFIYGENDGKSKETMQSPLDLALKYQSVRIAECLIEAHNCKAWLKEEYMSKIFSYLPEAIIPVLDRDGIKYDVTKFSERDEAVNAEFGFLVGFGDEEEGETNYLHLINKAPKKVQKKLFLHPLIQLFLAIKWNKMKLLALIPFFFHLFFVLCQTILVFEIFIPGCPGENCHCHNATISSDQRSLPRAFLFLWPTESLRIQDCKFESTTARVTAILLYLCILIVLMKMAFQVVLEKLKYFKSFPNILEFLLIILIIINTVPVWIEEQNNEEWQNYIASFGIFLGWTFFLRALASFPRWGVYSAMGWNVLKHMLKVTLFFFPLLAAFMIAFRYVIPDKGQFTFFFSSMAKMLVMIIGEVEYDGSFFDSDSKGSEQASSAYIMFANLFVVLIVFGGLLVVSLVTGEAVSDVQALRDEAEFIQQKRTLDQIHFWETFLSELNFCGKKRNDFNVCMKWSTVIEDYIKMTKIEGICIAQFEENFRERIKTAMKPEEFSWEDDLDLEEIRKLISGEQ